MSTNTSIEQSLDAYKNSIKNSTLAFQDLQEALWGRASMHFKLVVAGFADHYGHSWARANPEPEHLEQTINEIQSKVVPGAVGPGIDRPHIETDDGVLVTYGHTTSSGRITVEINEDLQSREIWGFVRIARPNGKRGVARIEYCDKTNIFKVVNFFSDGPGDWHSRHKWALGEAFRALDVVPDGVDPGEDSFTAREAGLLGDVIEDEGLK